MAAVRTVLAALIAISVALVPATGAVAPSTMPEMSMANHADMPCCAPDDCKGSIACAVKCFNFVAAMIPDAMSLSQIFDEALPALVDETLQGHVRSPPTHPPPL